jgi:PST family polysaccharide transporter
VGLAGRSALDKVLALRGGAELVALWAQVSSVMDLVAGVALNGVGAGLAVLVAQAPAEERRRLLSEALRLGLGAALPVAIVIGAAAWFYSATIPRGAIAVACLAGWAAIVPGLASYFWLGQEQRGPMLALASASVLVLLTAAATAPQDLLFEALAAAYAAPALVLLMLRRPMDRKPPGGHHALRRYVLPGLSIGILSPASLLAARALVADALSWHEAGVLQALWRLSDWVCGLAGGVLSVYYLPRLAAAQRRGELHAEIRAILARLVLPAALLLGALFAFHRPLLAALYQPGFVASDGTVALVFAGSLVRIASWVALFALYAMRRTSAIAIGELLSLPLFAALLALSGERLTLELAGALWLLSFAVYCGFNFWAVRRPW